MVRRSESGDLGGLWPKGHGRPEGSETPLGASSRVRRAAPSLQMHPEEPVEARYGLTRPASLTILEHPRHALEAEHVHDEGHVVCVERHVVRAHLQGRGHTSVSRAGGGHTT